MDDIHIGRQCWKAFSESIGSVDDSLRALTARARELLTKPVATREEVAHWVADGQYGKHTLTDLVFSALTHFAPPRQRMMIEGMTYTSIRDAMVDECAKSGGNLDEHDHEITQWCARVAHRLATTPAPEVDADAGAKAWLQTPAGAKAAWARLTSDQKAQVRAFAAMEKGNG